MSDIYPGCKAMTLSDSEEMETLNARNGYGFTNDEIEAMILEHQKAIRIAEMIEYRLTDANFHSESKRLHNGEYERLLYELP